MVAWVSLLFAVSLSISISTAFPSKENKTIIKLPDECKGERLCGKVKGYENLEEINSWVPDLLAGNHDYAEEGLSVQRGVRSMNIGHQNCLVEVGKDLLYNYMVSDSAESANSNSELIATCPFLRQSIGIVKCGQLPPPLSSDSKVQCFQSLVNKTENMKSSCETITSKYTLYFSNEDESKMYNRVFHIPIACSCIVSNI